MSNPMTLIAVDVEMRGRWGVGGVATDESLVRLPIIRDPRSGQPWIPGASVAGSLRHHLGDVAERWLGAPPGGFEQTTGNAERTPSRLAVLGGIVAATDVDEVTSTSVDGARGAAVGRTLRTAEAARPATVTLAFEHAGAHDEDLLQRLAEWVPVFGRGRSTGLGRGVVRQVRVMTADLATEAGLAWWLRDRQGWFTSGSAPDVLVPRAPIPGATRATASLTQDFVVVEPIRVGSGGRVLVDGREHLGIQMMGTAAVIPGSSWKGLFRHRCRMILEVVGASQAQADGVSAWLFGSLETGRGQLSFADTVVADPGFVHQTHVSIDRFTGGAKDGALFSTRALDRGQRLPLRIEWESGAVPDAVAGLLRHVMWDLHEGLISVGGMGSRGYGWVRIDHEAPERPGAVDLAALVAVVPLAETEAAS